MTELHVRKFQGGRITPEEFHAKYAFHPTARCTGCGINRPIARGILLLELKETLKRDTTLGVLMQAHPEQFVQTIVQTKYGPFFRASLVYACRSCLPEMERTLAKNCPDYGIVEINRGPGPDRPTVGYRGPSLNGA